MGGAVKRLCTICARGGSKGVLNKNIRSIAGKPLIAHSIEQAAASGLFSCIAVSSDSDEILQTAQGYGASLCVKRPAELATDQAAKLPAIAHCVREAECQLGILFDVAVDLDATSPLRTTDDIVGAVELLESTDAPNVITGCAARRSPYFNLVELDSGGAVRLSKPADPPVVRRQDAPPCFDMNASIYVWRRNVLLDEPRVFYPGTRLFVMSEERSADIDSELDFEWVEYLLRRRMG
ncbi:MAG: acylneuraminate cytidylyltransferase family protein [Sulfuritalea sp.]|nr:acylneuraminate cytidylyltransferase family protein [Sulfuritalea sp.]